MKNKKSYSNSLPIWKILAALDKKDYDFYINLSDDDKKNISPYLLLRWLSLIESNGDISKYYTIATNEYINNNFFDFYKHKELQWKLLCTVSPNIGSQRHSWIPLAVKKKSLLKEILLNILPTLKEEDIDLIINFNSKEDIKTWLSQCGIQTETIQKL